jgi:hypothetical protein
MEVGDVGVNAEAILALIADLYAQVAALSRQNQLLQQQLLDCAGQAERKEGSD